MLSCYLVILLSCYFVYFTEISNNIRNFFVLILSIYNINMGINQLFIKQPPIELVEKVIKSFGLKDFEDTTEFSLIDIQKNNTIVQLQNMKGELNEYYLPCKSRDYLNNWNYKGCITICRQLLKTVDKTLKSREKYINGKKYIVYKLADKIYKKKNKKLFTVDFD